MSNRSPSGPILASPDHFIPGKFIPAEPEASLGSVSPFYESFPKELARGQLGIASHGQGNWKTEELFIRKVIHESRELLGLWQPKPRSSSLFVVPVPFPDGISAATLPWLGTET